MTVINGFNSGKGDNYTGKSVYRNASFLFRTFRFVPRLNKANIVPTIVMF